MIIITMKTAPRRALRDRIDSFIHTYVCAHTQYHRQNEAIRLHGKTRLPSHDCILFLVLIISMLLDSSGGACARKISCKD